MDKLFIYAFFLLIIILDIVCAVKWYFVTKKLNQKLKQSFSPVFYALLMLIPLVNPFLVWAIIRDVKEYQIEKKMKDVLSVQITWWKLEIPYFLMVGAATIVLPVFVLISAILMALGIGIAEYLMDPILVMIISLASLFWFNLEMKKFSKIISDF